MIFFGKKFFLIIISSVVALGIITFSILGNTDQTKTENSQKTNSITYETDTTAPFVDNSIPDVLPNTENTQKTTTKDLTLTESVGRGLIANYLNTKSEYGTLSAYDKAEIVNQAIESASKRSLFYTETDFDAKDSLDTNTYKLYLNNLGNIFKENTYNLTDNELNIIGRVVTEGKNSEITKLDPIISAYKQITSQLLSIVVPKKYLKLHSDLTNYAAFLTQDVISMRKYFTDPMSALIAISNYQGDFYRFNKAFADIAELAKKEKITFQQGEGGYIIINGI